MFDDNVITRMNVDCLIGFFGKHIQEGVYYPSDLDLDDPLFVDILSDECVLASRLCDNGSMVPVDGFEYGINMSKAVRSAWCIEDHILLPFDDREARSGMACDIDACGLFNAIEPFRDTIAELFEKRKDTRGHSYVVLAFSYVSYRDHCDEWNNESDLLGEFDFLTGTIAEIED